MCDGSVVCVSGVGVGEADGFWKQFNKFVFGGDNYRGEKTGQTKQQDGLNYAFVKQQWQQKCYIPLNVHVLFPVLCANLLFSPPVYFVP